MELNPKRGLFVRTLKNFENARCSRKYVLKNQNLLSTELMVWGFICECEDRLLFFSKQGQFGLLL